MSSPSRVPPSRSSIRAKWKRRTLRPASASGSSPVTPGVLPTTRRGGPRGVRRRRRGPASTGGATPSPQRRRFVGGDADCGSDVRRRGPLRRRRRSDVGRGAGAAPPPAPRHGSGAAACISVATRLACCDPRPAPSTEVAPQIRVRSRVSRRRRPVVRRGDAGPWPTVAPRRRARTCRGERRSSFEVSGARSGPRGKDPGERDRGRRRPASSARPRARGTAPRPARRPRRRRRRALSSTSDDSSARSAPAAAGAS